MSAEGSRGVGRREVAYRLFAAEYDDAELEYSDSEEERAPNYVVTPTGARVNRLFVVGVLTELESVSDDVLRARVVDPTGAFVIYAGQYQPDAQTFLERAEPPMFVAVTGKARTYRPEDSERVFTSVRPESVNEVDADTRDRWTVQAAAHTLERVRTMAAALERPERGEELAAALRAGGVEAGLAEGVPLAIEHYGTTTAYLAALRDAAIQATEVVADERDEVEPIDLAPDEGGDVPLDADADLAAVAPGIGAAGVEANASGSTDSTGTHVDASEQSDDVPASAEDSTADAGADEGATGETEPVETVAAADGPEATATDSAAESDAGSADDLGDFDDFGADEGVETDELYELDEAERREVEEEYGTEFSTGTEVDEPGEADIETPEPDPDAGTPAEPEGDSIGTEPEEVPAGADGTAETADAETTDEPGEIEATQAAESGAEESGPAEVEGGSDVEPGAEPAAEGAEAAADDPEDVDLEDAVMDAMRDLDAGDGADRDAVIEAVVDAHGADPDDVEDAIQDALMGGRCYEPDDGRLKAI